MASCKTILHSIGRKHFELRSTLPHSDGVEFAVVTDLYMKVGLLSPQGEYGALEIWQGQLLLQ